MNPPYGHEITKVKERNPLKQGLKPDHIDAEHKISRELKKGIH